MAVIGFVGAGLMTFPQALGVILGANIGTTTTGWMVALLGVRFDLGLLAMPLLFLASFLALLGRGAWASLGTGVSGFALVFIGIGVMESGVTAVEPVLAGFLGSGDSLSGRLALVGAGFVFTALTQSSSAGVATAIMMLSGGAIDLVQAAALVIGMDIGTTVKAVLTTIGGARDIRRTAYAHVGYNLLTGIIGIALVTQVGQLLRFTGGDGATALTLFHTLLNLAGAALVLPFAFQATRLVEWLVPAKGGPLPELLDRQLLGDPITAIDAAASSASRIAAVQFGALAQALRGNPDGSEVASAIRGAIEDLEGFVSEIPVPDANPGQRRRVSAILHMIDHMNRLEHRAGQPERIASLRDGPALSRPSRALAALLAQGATDPLPGHAAAQAARLGQLIRQRSARLRGRELDRDGDATGDVHDLFRVTDGLRWAERVSAHAERILHYAAAARSQAPTAAEVSRTVA
jgi:phosphate:Na+ symporter